MLSVGNLPLGLQTGHFRVGTILDLDVDPFINNGFGSWSDSDSTPFLLVPNSFLIGGPKSGTRIRSN